MKHIAILGSTGSIGQSTLEVIRHFPKELRVAALTTNSNVDILCRQIKLFRPLAICINNADAALDFRSRLNTKGIKLFVGQAGLEEVVQGEAIDKVVLAISGSGALMPLLKAIECGKDIALANKEALVMAGSIIMKKAARKKIKIIPIDSEQSAIWQCLTGEDKSKLKNIYLTASGGPLRKVTKRGLMNISVSKVLRHPKWKMGLKITVDSATLMNKGLEVLEAMHLFCVRPDKIKVLIHPEALIHSMVEFVDGVVMAQLSITDMRIPIQYALNYPERLGNSLPGLDFYKVKELNFQRPNFQRFPCLGLAYRVAREEGTMPAVLNAANEISAEQFLKRRLGFISIPRVIEKVLGRHRNKIEPDLGDILEADRWARQEAHRVIDKLSN